MTDLEKLMSEFTSDAEKLADTVIVPQPEFGGFRDIELPSICDLTEMGQTVAVALGVNERIEQLEEALEQLKTYNHTLLSRVLPAMFLASGSSTLFGTNTHVVELKPYLAIKKPENEEPGYLWLENNGHGALIKNTISLNFDKTDFERAAEAEKALEDYWDVLSRKKGVHASTLTSFLKGQIKDGTVVPLELFGATTGSIAVIKARKTK